MATKRTAEAFWIESKSYWQVKVQRDGVRKAFTSSIKGRKGKHAAEVKADEWLEKGTEDMRFPAAWDAFMAVRRARTGTANVTKLDQYYRVYLAPEIKERKLSAITPIMWQACIDAAGRKGLSERYLRQYPRSHSFVRQFRASFALGCSAA